MTRTAVSAEHDHTQIGSWGNSPHGIRGAKIFIKKIQKGGILHFQGITEAVSRPLLRLLSSTHQSAVPHHADLPWRRPPEVLPCWTEDFVCPAAHLVPELLPCKRLTAPLPPVLPVFWMCRLRLWDSGSLSPIDCCVCYISRRLLECEQDIDVC